MYHVVMLCTETIFRAWNVVRPRAQLDSALVGSIQKLQIGS